VIEEKSDFLIAWFREAVAAGRLDEEETEPSQAAIVVPPGSKTTPNPAPVPLRPKPSMISTGKQPVRLSLPHRHAFTREGPFECGPKRRPKEVLLSDRPWRRYKKSV
jgi:hypothetical protein